MIMLGRLSILISLAVAGIADAQSTGTFIDRLQPTDLRLMSYNVEFDTIFSDTSPTQSAKIARLIQAVWPDILTLQEIYDHSAADVVNLMNSLLPLGGGGTWHAYQGFDNVIASKYPLSLTRSTTIPNPPSTSYAIALIDLPDAEFTNDFYFMDGHFKCCGGFDDQRQRQADALVNWMRDARTTGGAVNLPGGTPMAAVGDFNIVESLDPLNTLISGDIVNEGSFGPDSPPDWDGTSLADARPLHNETGSDDYTWRADSSDFDPGRLDYVLYTDSVVSAPKRFILNTTVMTSAERAAAGLQLNDSNNSPGEFDHLPLVVDFRFPQPQLAGDYNSDSAVDTLDYDVWRTDFGSTSSLAADGNANGVVDAADYVIWREQISDGSSADLENVSSAVAEPASLLLCMLAGGAFTTAVRREPRISI